MNPRFCFLFLLVLLLSCNDKQEQLPVALKLKTDPAVKAFTDTAVKLRLLAYEVSWDDFLQPLELKAKIVRQRNDHEVREYDVEITVENYGDKIQCIGYYCSPETIFMLTRPYYFSLRSSHGCYSSFMSRECFYAGDRKTYQITVSRFGRPNSPEELSFRVGISMDYHTCWSNELVPSVI